MDWEQPFAGHPHRPVWSKTFAFGRYEDIHVAMLVSNMIRVVVGKPEAVRRIRYDDCFCCFLGRPSIAGYRKTLVLDNRTAYHGYFEFLRLEAGFELSSSGLMTPDMGQIETEVFDCYEVGSYWPRGTGSRRYSTANFFSPK
jgi:hypothetical protein